MKAIVRRIGGLSLAGKSGSNHWVAMDGPSDIGGFDAATKPMELVLIALGGCTAIDVLSIMRKKRIKLDDYEVEIDSERADQHPKVFTRIELVHRFYGENLKEKDLEFAVNLSEEKHCSVSAMLKSTAQITSRIEILPPRPAR